MRNLFRFAYLIKNKVKYLELKLLAAISGISTALSSANQITKKLQITDKPIEIKAEVNTDQIKDPTPLSKDLYS